MRASFFKSAILALGAIAMLASCEPKEKEEILVSIGVSSTSADGKFNLDLTLSGSVSSDVTVALEQSGTAPEGSLSFDKSATIPAGSTSAKVPVTVNLEGLAPGTYEAIFTIVSANGAKVNPAKNFCKVTLEAKAEARPSVFVSQYSEKFTDGKASLTLALDKAAKEDVVVKFEVKTEGDGYVAIPAEALTFDNPATIPAGQTSLEVAITVDIDAIPGGATCYAVIAIASVSENADVASTKTKTYIEASKNLVANERKDWTVSYGGEVEHEGEMADVISVSGVGEDGNYYVYVYSKGLVNKYFPDGMQSYLEYMEGVIVESMGTEDAPSIKSGDHDWLYNTLSVGEYEVWLLGCTPAGHITGDYASCTFSKEASPEVLEAYNKWLGEWTVSRDSVSDEWEIIENVPGASFYIKGIDGNSSYVSDALAEADYDSAKDEIVIYGQTVKQLKIEGKTYDLLLLGLIDNKVSLVSGEFDLARIGWTSASTAQIKSPGKVNMSDGAHDVTGMCYFASDPDSSNGYVFNGQVFYNWPETMDKAVPIEDDAEYNSLLGTWKISRMNSEYDEEAQDYVETGVVDDNWTFTPRIAGRSYYVSGFEGYEDVVFVAKYDSKKKTISVSEQEIVLKDESGELVLHLCGLFTYTDGNVYLYDGGNEMFTGKKDKAGKLKLTAGKAGSYGDFLGMQLFIYEYDEVEDKDHYYQLHGDGYELPNTLTKVADAQSAPACISRTRRSAVSTPVFTPGFTFSRRSVSVSRDEARKSL